MTNEQLIWCRRFDALFAHVDLADLARRSSRGSWLAKVQLRWWSSVMQAHRWMWVRGFEF